MLSRKGIFGIIGAFVLLVVIFSASKFFENVDAGEIVFVQDPMDGEIHVYKTAGFIWQGWGKATHYKKSNTFWFNIEGTGEEAVDKTIPVKWNDGGTADIEGSIRYDLPLDDSQLVALHSTFGSQEGIENAVIKVNMEKAVYFTGPLMTSKESYAEKKNDLIHYIEDQASRGVYKTRQIDVKEVDPLSGTEKVVTRVQIQVDSAKGVVARQEVSPVGASGIKLYNLSIKGIHYDKTVEQQIATQQKALMEVQTAIANAKRAEQDALTAEKQGQADAAKAKWAIEVTKAEMVTKAEAEKAKAELDVQTAALNKQKLTLEGEGEAAKKRAAMVANGGLEQKLDAWLKAQKYWADAFAQYQGSVVPQIQTGGQAGNGAINFMELMGIKAARDLNLDLSNKK
jgi:regulator of protease activity HflC (stomatin/prohibitin superfamily)